MSNLTPIRVVGTLSPSGTQDVRIIGADSATITVVPLTTASTPLLVENPLRKGWVVQADVPIFLSLTDTASSSVYSYDLPQKAIVEVDWYSGPVTACTVSGTGSARVTEKF